MTPQEFKAWFEGFTEAFAGCPTKAQWARVKERVAEIDGKSVTERIYLDRYWPLYNQQPPYWARYQSYNAAGVGATTAAASNSLAASANNYAALAQGQNFNAMNAMHALGKAEALS